jgi:hypothetical protein
MITITGLTDLIIKNLRYFVSALSAFYKKSHLTKRHSISNFDSFTLYYVLLISELNKHVQIQ